jgi:hypothetical protein
MFGGPNDVIPKNAIYADKCKLNENSTIRRLIVSSGALF